MKRNNRDDFSAATVRDLARRASYICSNPECHNLTIGPASNDLEKIVFLGKAAHITAASPRGARYDSSLAAEDRRAIKNGIFLCPGCADKIDKNKGLDYPIALLKNGNVTMKNGSRRTSISPSTLWLIYERHHWTLHLITG